MTTSNGKNISSFKGGKVSVTVNVPKSLKNKKIVCIYVDANGTYKTEISEEQQKTLQRLINWQYYKLFDEKNP